MNQNLQNLFLKEVLAKVYKINPSISGGGGSSMEDAVVINLDDTTEAVRLERSIVIGLSVFLGKEPEVQKQEHLSKGSKHYDMLTLALKGDTNTYQMYFDITQSFSKLEEKFSKSGI